MFNIEEELKKLPGKPGVYVMRDKNNNIIYVGKAVSLKNRVRSYFRKTNKTERIKKMVSLIDHFEYIVVDNEAEALILECNLIKKNRPKFNVLLKDDKTYPYIKIDVKSEYPNVFITRRLLNDGAKYFGPYANPGAAKEMVDFIKQKYKIRQCKNFKSNTRPCLNYHINRCLAPCMGYVTPEEYRKQIDEIIDLLEGKTEKILRDLDTQMQEALVKTSVKNLYICPSNISLAGAEVELVSMMSREQRLKEKLDEIKDSFDYILIDCPPSLGLITLNSFTASDSSANGKPRGHGSRRCYSCRWFPYPAPPPALSAYRVPFHPKRWSSPCCR